MAGENVGQQETAVLLYHLVILKRFDHGQKISLAGLFIWTSNGKTQTMHEDTN